MKHAKDKTHKCPGCGTQYRNWFGTLFCRVCEQHDREIRFEVRIPYSKPTYNALMALHEQTSGGTFTVRMAEKMIHEAVLKALPEIQEFQVRCTSNPNWTAYPSEIPKKAAV